MHINLSNPSHRAGFRPSYECACASLTPWRRRQRAIVAGLASIGVVLFLVIGSTVALAQALPRGAIVAWSEDVADIPAGWRICNGEDGAIDLVGKYIKGTTSGPELNQVGGSKTTTVAGGYTPTLSMHDGTWSLNPEFGSTRFDPVAGHQHAIDPVHLSVAFILVSEHGADGIPDGVVAFMEGDTLPDGWVEFPARELDLASNLLLLGSEARSDEVLGGRQTRPGGAHTPSVTAKGGTMSLNPSMGSTGFDPVDAHAHAYTLPYQRLTAVRNTKDTSVVPEGLIVPWVGSPAAVPHGWALCDGEDGTPNLHGRYVVVNPQSLTPVAGGGDWTEPAGAHTFGINTGKGGTMSLNPRFGSTGPGETGDHQHQADPPHVKLPFIKFVGQASK